MHVIGSVLAAFAILILPAQASVMPEITLQHTPGGGIQPQAVTDEQGLVHLIYFQGAPEGGDIFYVRQQRRDGAFSNPLRVNSQPGSAIAVGSIRGAHLALGRGDRPHVSWMGSQRAEPARVQGRKVTPMLYTRLNDAGTAFEPERNVLTWAAGLDGGGSLAADPAGNVYVAWHASTPDNQREEAGRAVFVARSTDDGKNFSREQKASAAPTGACGCCGMRAFADRHGDVFMLYRAATDQVQRDMTLLWGKPGGAAYQTRVVGPWHLTACPMSSAAFAEGPSQVLAAWETADQVEYCAFDPSSGSASAVRTPPGAGKRKHPSVAVNHRGQVLLAWTEDTAWAKGGSVGWQCFDATGQPLGERGHTDGVPVWGLVSVVARPDGGFVLFY